MATPAVPGAATYEPVYPGGGPATKPVPERYGVSKVTYDGRILALYMVIHKEGELSLGIPVRCDTGPPADCRRKMVISRQVVRQEDLMIRRRLEPRLDERNRLNLSFKLVAPDGALIAISALRPKVHKVKPR